MMAHVMVPSRKTTSLADIARAVGAVRVLGDASVRVSGVRQDSRHIQPGDLFAVRAGAKTSGWLHVEDALRRGAVALLAEPVSGGPVAVPVIEVADAQVAIARAATLVYGDPTSVLDVVGITGTNGKTTTTHLVEHMLEACGKRPGAMGTLGYRFEEWRLDAPHTTPQADDVARIAAEMLERGATHLIMEVSSHALSQGRVEGVRFRAAAFTNLTQDHLDFHGDMDAYGRAKARLFLELEPGVSVVNVDDPFGAELAKRIGGRVLCVSARPGAPVEIAPLEVSVTERGTTARVRTPAGEAVIESPLLGAHNLSNLLVALGIAVGLELPLPSAARALSEMEAVPGRLERCDGPDDDIRVLVDYAHTPDALERVLAALRPVAPGPPGGRLICVFGCGGDRDPTKRAPMGEAVARWADLAVVTSDNPRSEDPAAIVAQILPGLAALGERAVVELDRAAAIDHAVGAARPGDVVLVAGKGHEDYQIIGATRRHFDDRQEARRALAARRGRV
jgi:UDP-N-acetylmuramoyl-L-alanyl-D-glutamate--2,6-diaminopimelate ligase